MKFSELSTDRALDVMCELTPSIANIMEDEEVISALGNIMPEEKQTPKFGNDSKKQDGSRLYLTGIKMIGGMVKIAPVLLKTHRPDVYNILSVMYEKPIAEISTQPIADTIRQVREVLQDNDLLSFFKSFTQRGQNEQFAPSAGSPA